MFIRLKKVKKRDKKIYEYAHLVHGVWRKRRSIIKEGKGGFRKFNNSIHSYKGFLGRVYKFDDEKKVEFDSFFSDFRNFVNKNEVNKIYEKLLEYELLSRGFAKKRGLFVNEGIFVDLNRLIVHNGRGDVVVKLRAFSGCLCSFTLNELFKVDKVTNRYEGMYLMKKLKAVGIALSGEQFFILVDELLKKNSVNN